jgi:hypothetical protein
MSFLLSKIMSLSEMEEGLLSLGVSYDLRPFWGAKKVKAQLGLKVPSCAFFLPEKI